MRTAHPLWTRGPHSPWDSRLLPGVEALPTDCQHPSVLAHHSLRSLGTTGALLGAALGCLADAGDGWAAATGYVGATQGHSQRASKNPRNNHPGIWTGWDKPLLQTWGSRAAPGHPCIPWAQQTSTRSSLPCPGQGGAGLPAEPRGPRASWQRALLVPAALPWLRSCSRPLWLCRIEQNHSGDYSLLEPKLAEQDRAALS